MTLVQSYHQPMTLIRQAMFPSVTRRGWRMKLSETRKMTQIIDQEDRPAGRETLLSHAKNMNRTQRKRKVSPRLQRTVKCHRRMALQWRSLKMVMAPRKKSIMITIFCMWNILDTPIRLVKVTMVARTGNIIEMTMVNTWCIESIMLRYTARHIACQLIMMNVESHHV